MICETVNCGFKLHKLNIPPQNTSFWVFCCRKFDLWKCQLWLEIAQMRYFTANTSFCAFYKWKISFVQIPTLTLNCTNAIIHRKHVFLIVLQWKNRFVQLPTLTLNRTNAIFHIKTRIFECFGVENPIYASVNSGLILHKCGIPQQKTSFCSFYSGKSALCKCQLWL